MKLPSPVVGLEKNLVRKKGGFRHRFSTINKFYWNLLDQQPPSQSSSFGISQNVGQERRVIRCVARLIVDVVRAKPIKEQGVRAHAETPI
jgi:hypothetical protein